MLYDVALGDESFIKNNGDADKWRMTFGMQWSQYSQELHYDKFHDHLRLDISKSHNSKLLPFSYFTIEKNLTKNSGINLSYTNDTSSSLLVGQKNVVVLGFLLMRPIVQSPVNIDLNLLRLHYFHTIARSGNVEFGGTGGVQALYVQAKAESPVLGYSEDNYFIVLPSFGLYTKYQPTQRLRYALRVDYLPVPLDTIQGTSTDIECTMEYKVNSLLFIGAGGRYSIKSLDLEGKKYQMNTSYGVHGGLLFAGIYL